MVKLDRVRKAYRGSGREVLAGVELHLPKGQLAVLTGPSGAGKTTLLHLILGAELDRKSVV